MKNFLRERAGRDAGRDASSQTSEEMGWKVGGWTDRQAGNYVGRQAGVEHTVRAPHLQGP